MIRVAAIDCGTNSIRLLIADLHEGPGAPMLRDVERRMEVVRLGQGVDRTGRFAPEALERTGAALRDYARLCAELGVERIRFGATSATRDAQNREDFISDVVSVLGVEPEVITGDEEAALSFAGAVSSLARAPEPHPGPVMVVDIGGGSTEFVVGGTSPDAAVSVDVGSVRLTERLLSAEVPTGVELDAARAEVRARIDEAAEVVPLSRPRTLVGVAGTITTVTAHALRLPTYHPEAIDGAQLTPDQVRASCADLLAATRAERAAMGFMHPGRVDVIGAGALIWSEIVGRVDADVRATGASLSSVVTSEHDILDGLALSLA
ncbi:Ppx/GppA phosphatase family protein [Bogoriella caseilytica]|uniref:Ppx/GppA phosphatase n=1 Tax=Bogoriella caseilytica TaxID=56055 RepID=A0A3N2BAD0_9MICO|nr:Ppx/GppA phosphatase family protein [Bogoriella caseilytica]ROR72229.1 Ppx/GppA phosphatase [Bogoriella caseilytica]